MRDMSEATIASATQFDDDFDEAFQYRMKARERRVQKFRKSLRSEYDDAGYASARKKNAGHKCHGTA